MSILFFTSKRQLNHSLQSIRLVQNERRVLDPHNRQCAPCDDPDDPDALMKLHKNNAARTGQGRQIYLPIVAFEGDDTTDISGTTSVCYTFYNYLLPLPHTYTRNGGSW